ncbi:hypothetical protein N0V90_013177 [Kalmusia sp. IMI 367209]|nr:hypothetical protein N0V90_013177 [Kalmusia sp. IMI 367209]
MLLTCDPRIARDIFASSNEFKGASRTLQIYNIYGPTLAACGEEDWKRYRKVLTPYFSTATNAVILRETLTQTEALLNKWSTTQVMTDVKNQLAARLTIGVIAQAFFGKSIAMSEYDSKVRKGSGNTSFGEAILNVNEALAAIVPLRAVPSWFRAVLPKTITDLADVPYNEWKRHMVDLHSAVSSKLRDPVEQRGEFKTLLENLISAGMTEDDIDSKVPPLTQDEVFGNIFFIILAGYDTASTTISFAILLLALHQKHQRSLQEQIDAILGDSRTASSWDLRLNFQTLLDGFVGAVIKETLRLYCPVEWLPKIAMTDTSVTDSNGAWHFVAKGTTCCIDFAAIFRHPKHWASPSEQNRNGREELTPPLQFDPSRWIRKDDSGGNIGAEAYFPFGGGQRICPGRKFAEILMAAVLGRIFSEFSVEFDIGEQASNAAAEKGLGESWAAEQVRGMAIASLYEGVGFHHGIYPEQHPPLKFVRRK